MTTRRRIHLTPSLRNELQRFEQWKSIYEAQDAENLDTEMASEARDDAANGIAEELLAQYRHSPELDADMSLADLVYGDTA